MSTSLRGIRAVKIPLLLGLNALYFFQMSISFVAVLKNDSFYPAASSIC